MKPVILNDPIIAETLSHLQEGGRRGIECVVLWFGDETDQEIVVRHVYRPEQMAGPDIFHIPPPAMSKIMNELAVGGLMIAAQVHSHPMEAFHSRADDTWAIIRHLDALSLVLPYFALETDAASFFQDMKAFHLTSQNKWVELLGGEVRKWIIQK